MYFENGTLPIAVESPTVSYQYCYNKCENVRHKKMFLAQTCLSIFIVRSAYCVHSILKNNYFNSCIPVLTIRILNKSTELNK